MRRPPDSRASAGQQREQLLDGVAYGMRRDTRTWIKQKTRGHPNDAEILSSTIAGIAAALLDELWASTQGDAARLCAGWAGMAEDYVNAIAEDQAGDDETSAKGTGDE